jgi:hypothetical protein
VNDWWSEYVKGEVKEYYWYIETYNVTFMWRNGEVSTLRGKRRNIRDILKHNVTVMCGDGEVSMLKGKWRNITDILKHIMLHLYEGMVKWVC